MLTSDLIQMLLDAQNLAEEEVEIRGAILTDEYGVHKFHQCTIVGAQLFHNPDSGEQEVKLIVHEQPNRNGDRMLSEIKSMVRDNYSWQDRKYFETTEVV